MTRKRGNVNYFDESLFDNSATYQQYLKRLAELSVSMFEWKNLPGTVDMRYLEMQLFRTGSAVFFEDEVIGYLALGFTPQGGFDIYGNPVSRRAYSAYNNYSKYLTSDNSVVIWNNYVRTNSLPTVVMFAKRLYNLDRIIDVNANAQKTPILIQASEKQRLTLLNVYKEYQGNAPAIFGDKNLDLNSLTVLKTDAPYIADKIYQLKVQIWNEALTYLGISNMNIQKKERLITDEVTRNQGGTIASRYSRLEERRQAAKKINDMFGLNIEVNYREDFQEVPNDNTADTVGTDTIAEDENE